MLIGALSWTFTPEKALACLFLIMISFSGDSRLRCMNLPVPIAEVRQVRTAKLSIIIFSCLTHQKRSMRVVQSFSTCSQIFMATLSWMISFQRCEYIGKANRSAKEPSSFLSTPDIVWQSWLESKGLTRNGIFSTCVFGKKTFELAIFELLRKEEYEQKKRWKCKAWYLSVTTFPSLRNIAVCMYRGRWLDDIYLKIKTLLNFS
jgi:hypothetical protein